MFSARLSCTSEPMLEHDADNVSESILGVSLPPHRYCTCSLGLVRDIAPPPQFSPRISTSAIATSGSLQTEPRNGAFPEQHSS